MDVQLVDLKEVRKTPVTTKQSLRVSLPIQHFNLRLVLKKPTPSIYLSTKPRRLMIAKYTQTEKVDLSTEQLKILHIIKQSGVTNEELFELLEKHRKIKGQSDNIIDVDKYVENKINNTIAIATIISDNNKKRLIENKKKEEEFRPAAAKDTSSFPLNIPLPAPTPAPPVNNFANEIRETIQVDVHSNNINMALDTQEGQKSRYPIVAPLIGSQPIDYNKQVLLVHQLNQQADKNQLQCQQPQTLKAYQLQEKLLQQQLLQNQQMQQQHPQQQLNVPQTQLQPRMLRHSNMHRRSMYLKERNSQHQYPHVSTRRINSDGHEYADPRSQAQMHFFPGDPRAWSVQRQPQLRPRATRVLSTQEANLQSAHFNQQPDYRNWNNQDYWEYENDWS